jgi:hypothetical protein
MEARVIDIQNREVLMKAIQPNKTQLEMSAIGLANGDYQLIYSNWSLILCRIVFVE